MRNQPTKVWSLNGFVNWAINETMERDKAAESNWQQGGNSMEIIKYPSKEYVNIAIHANDPLLELVSFDSRKMIVAPIDEAVEYKWYNLKKRF